MKKNFLYLILIALISVISTQAQNYSWSRMPSCPTTLYQPAMLTIGNSIYVISGLVDHNHSPLNVSQQVWEFNTVTNQWSQKNNFPGTGIYSPSNFVIGNYGYVVNGWDSLANATGPSELWRYDPSTDSWTQKAAFPAGNRYSTASFSANGKGYVATGFKPYTSEVYEYNPTSDSWTQKSNFPGLARQATTWFTIGNTVYMGMGATGTPWGVGYFIQSDWYKYDAANDSWTQLGYFPGNAITLTGQFVLNGEAYVMGGINQNQINSSNGANKEIWKYTPNTDTWTMVGLFPDTGLAGGVYGNANGSGFIGLGDQSYIGTTSNAWYRFGLAPSTSSCKATINAIRVTNSNFNFQALGNFSSSATLHWTFSDNVSAVYTGSSVVKQFPTSGTYLARLTVTDSAHGGCSYATSDTINVRINTNCNVNITTTHFQQDYTLAANATGAAPFTYNWSSSQNPTFYSNAPNPLVALRANMPTSYCVTITDTAGCVSKACDTVTYVPASIPCQVFLYVYPDLNVPGVYYCDVLSSGGNIVSYNWTLGNGYTSTDSFFTYTFPNTGFYNLCLTTTDVSGCTSSYCDSFFYAYKTGGGPIKQIVTKRGAKKYATAINDLSATSLSLTPNPSTSELNINMNGAKIEGVSIYNVTGQKVREITSPTSAKVQVADLSTGIYVIEVKSTSGVARGRFIKE